MWYQATLLALKQVPKDNVKNLERHLGKKQRLTEAAYQTKGSYV